MGVFDFLSGPNPAAHPTAAGKVVNTPGCPTNPWWFVLTVVALTVDLKGILVDGNAEGPLKILKAHNTSAGHPKLGDNPIVEPSTGVDDSRRIKAVYGTSVHGPYCPRYQYFVQGKFAANPGDRGCLQKLGCKGPAASSLCGVHGWNGQQPTNPVAWDHGVSNANLSPGGVPTGGHCTRAVIPAWRAPRRAILTTSCHSWCAKTQKGGTSTWLIQLVLMLSTKSTRSHGSRVTSNRRSQEPRYRLDR